jgi:hypothetical protein
MNWSRREKAPTKRLLNEQDVSGFLAATAKREREPSLNKKLVLSDLLYKHNPWRWHRMRSDVKWARKVLQKAGYDPEEIRWIL